MPSCKSASKSATAASRGASSLRLISTKSGKAISSKIPQYIAYWHQEQAQPDSGRLFPRVLMLAPTQQRTRYLARIVAGRPDFAKLFQVGLLGSVSKSVMAIR
jgi:hypothetical protein